MKTQSSITPKSLQIVDLGKVCKVRMCKNIEQITREDEQIYQYDEVVFKINNRPNLEDDIKQNFEAYFAFGEQYMRKQHEEEEKNKEINRLIHKKEQVDENKTLAQHLVERELDAIMMAQQLIELELQLLEVKLS